MKTIVAIDGSECSKLALDAVNSRSWTPEDEFIVLTVAQPVPLEFGLCASASDTEECEEQIYAEVAEVAAKGGLALKGKLPNNKIEAKVLTGKPAEQITDCAKSWEADLIVVGSHGRRGFQHLMLGSVAEEVLKKAPCSVQIVIDKAAHRKARKKAQLVASGNETN